MVALDRLAPQTWCVLGNCFSLQREFETAVKFFHRAIQVDATFTYAYTLAGHEHVSNEDFDKATASFRDALRYDQRHYNAWYCVCVCVCVCVCACERARACMHAPCRFLYCSL
jgi:anaphase-promoting complex subunit 3